MTSFLIAGLGNIGAEYEGTRHNIGFDVVAALVAKHGGSFSGERLAALSEIKFKGRTLTCILPTTYMNLSGKAVKYWLDRKKIPVERCWLLPMIWRCLYPGCVSGRQAAMRVTTA